MSLVTHRPLSALFFFCLLQMLFCVQNVNNVFCFWCVYAMFDGGNFTKSDCVCNVAQIRAESELPRLRYGRGAAAHDHDDGSFNRIGMATATNQFPRTRDHSFSDETSNLWTSPHVATPTHALSSQRPENHSYSEPTTPIPNHCSNHQHPPPLSHRVSE